MSTTLASSPRRTSSLGGFDVEMIEGQAAVRELEPEWRRFLAGEVYGHNLFNDPAHILLRLEIEPDQHPLVVVLRRAGHIRCIAAFVYHATRLKLNFSVKSLASFPIRMLKVVGSDFILANDEDFQNCCMVVFKAVWEYRSTFGLIYIQNLKADSGLWSFCRSPSLAQCRYRPFIASSEIDTVQFIQLTSTYEEYFSQVNPKTRQSLRRKTRKLRTEQGAYLERITTPAQVPRFLGLLDEIYRDCWQAELNGYRSRRTDAEIEYLTGIAERGWLRSYLLMDRRGPLAFILGYQYNGTFFHYETGYAHHRSDRGPGTVILHLCIEDLFQIDPPRLVDFIMGDQSYKRSFSNRQISATYLYLVPHHRWQVLLSFQKAAYAIERVARRMVTKCQMADVVRGILTRKPRLPAKIEE